MVSTTTLNHPQSENPPADLSLLYQWSTNLVDWHNGDGVDGPPDGATVSISTETMNTNATVTAQSSEAMDSLFLRTGAIQEH